MKTYFLVSILFVSRAVSQKEGEECVWRRFKPGVCINLKRCQMSIIDIKLHILPQVCSFDGVEPIVCCLDNKDTLTTEKSDISEPQPVDIITQRSPSVNDYLEEPEGICQISPPLGTVPPRTGKISLDKCIEYQEHLIYPCNERTESGQLTRSDQCYHDPDSMDVDNEEAQQNEFPHMALLGFGVATDVAWNCGGTLISDKFILTAAQCQLSSDHGYVTYAALGILKRQETKDWSNIYNVLNVFVHPEYKRPSVYNDIALLELENRVMLNKFIVPACLDDGETLFTESAVSIGWGGRLYGDDGVEIMKKMPSSRYTREECSKTFEPSGKMEQGIIDSLLCYGNRTGGTEVCLGDGGGPLQIKSKKIKCTYVVVGVSSFGKSCGLTDTPDIYTRVENFLPWIESIVWNATVDTKG